MDRALGRRRQQAAAALNVQCRYRLIEVAGAGRDELRALLDDVKRLGFSGVNVTFPYKEAVVELLDEVSPAAAALGAVNAVVVRDGRLTGYNTDTTGFARAAADGLHQLRNLAHRILSNTRSSRCTISSRPRNPSTVSMSADLRPMMRAASVSE